MVFSRYIIYDFLDNVYAIMEERRREMIQVDDDFMREVGLESMPAEERADFMRDAEEELEVRIGQAIGKKLTAEQVEEFEVMTDARMAAEWLSEYVPDYREVAEQVYEEFKAEIKAQAA